MRISYCSSDVCSSDLHERIRRGGCRASHVRSRRIMFTDFMAVLVIVSLCRVFSNLCKKKDQERIVEFRSVECDIGKAGRNSRCSALSPRSEERRVGKECVSTS